MSIQSVALKFGTTNYSMKLLNNTTTKFKYKEYEALNYSEYYFDVFIKSNLLHVNFKNH